LAASPLSGAPWYYGSWIGTTGTVPVFNNSITITTATGKAAHIFQIPKTGTLEHVEFMTGTVSAGSTTSFKLSWQDLDTATGAPDGTADQYTSVLGGTMTSNTWIQPGKMTNDGTSTGTQRSVTRGDFLACVIEFDIFNTGNSFALATPGEVAGDHWSAGGFPFLKRFVSPSWTDFTSTVPNAILKYSDGSYENIGTSVFPIATFATNVINTGTTPDEVGNLFQVPVGCSIKGVTFWVDGDGDYTVVLYDSTSNILTSVTIDKDYRSATAAAITTVYFPTSVTLSANTDYRIAILPTTATSLTVYSYTTPGATWTSLNPGGTTWKHSTRTNAGAWTDTADKTIWMLLHIDGFSTTNIVAARVFPASPVATE